MFTILVKTGSGINCEYACGELSELHTLLDLLDKSKDIKQYAVFEFSELYDTKSHRPQSKQISPKSWNK